MAKSILYTAESRGMTNQGWIHSRHTFSFGGYYDAEKIHFGALRVINDDMIAPGKGFGSHPHSNMEIISIPLDGELYHKDSLNVESVIKPGHIQVMSAGDGIFHSEYNKRRDCSLKMIQIWIMPKVLGAKARYEQMEYSIKENDFTELISPDLHDDSMWVYQDVWFYLGHIHEGRSLNYFLKNAKENGVYIFMIDGETDINGEKLTTRDGIGLWEISEIKITASRESRFLLMEIPMH